MILARAILLAISTLCLTTSNYDNQNTAHKKIKEEEYDFGALWFLSDIVPSVLIPHQHINKTLHTMVAILY